jgi:hypothetical protein
MAPEQMQAWEWLPVFAYLHVLDYNDRSDDVGGTLVNNREKIHAVYLFSHSRQLGKCSIVSESLLYIVTVFLWEWSRHEISFFFAFSCWFHWWPLFIRFEATP